MLKRRALRKMLITTITVFILLVVYLIPTKEEPKELTTNMEVEYVSDLGTNSIYLLNEDNYLVKSKILLMSKQLDEQVSELIENLTVGDKIKLPSRLQPLIPSNVKLLGVKITDDIVILNFSKEFLQISKEQEEKVIEAIVYTLGELKNIKGVTIKVENEILTELPNSKKKLPEVLTKEFGINKVYDLEDRNSIHKVTVYYIEDTESDNYYVPVTKYVNDDRDKIKIIVDNLTSKYIYEPNLMSFLNQDTELLDYKVEDQLMILNFNDAIFTEDDKILEEVIYSIAYSVFDNYDVNEVLFEVDNQQIVKKSLNSLE